MFATGLNTNLSFRFLRCCSASEIQIQELNHLLLISLSTSLTSSFFLYILGWLIGPPELTLATLQASTRIIFCTNSPLQEAVAAGLERAEEHNFFPDQIQAYTERRDTLTKYFDELGLSYTVPEGSYFVLVNIEKIKTPQDYDFPAVVKGRGADFE